MGEVRSTGCGATFEEGRGGEEKEKEKVEGGEE